MGRAFLPTAGLCLITLLFSASRTPAQYRFDHWTTDDGLPQNTIRDLVQTRDGYLWFTTFDGLVRFDGVHFTVFDKGNTPGILSNRFFGIVESNDGAIYAHTEEGILTVCRQGNFRSYTPANGVPGKSVTDFRSDGDGEAILKTDTGSYYLRQEKFIPVSTQYQTTWAGNFHIGPTGRFWWVDTQGVRLKQNGQETPYHFPLKNPNVDTGTALLEDRHGTLWAGSLAGLFQFRDGVVRRLSEADGVPPGLFLRPFCDDSEGGIWFVTGGLRIGQNHVARYKGGRLTIFGAESGMPEADIGKIIRDREGTIWIGTSKGLYRARKQLITSYSTEEGLAGKEVYPLLQIRNGDILVGAVEAISVFRDGRFSKLSSPVGWYSQALWEDPRGRLWIGHIGGMHWFKGGQAESVSAHRLATVFAVRPDRQGNVWVAHGAGLFKYKDDKIVAEYTNNSGLPSTEVSDVYEARDGALWIGSYGGLTQLKDGKFTTWTTKEGLASDRVRAIYEDADGALWIGTYDGGLSRFRDGRFFNYTVENGLFNNGVFAILEDRRHNFWISCNRGIYRVNRQELNDFADGKIAQINCIAYGKSDGMRSTECNGGRQPAGLIARDGKFWFPTQDGVAVVDPEGIADNRLPPPVEIESVSIDRHAVPFKDGVRMSHSQTGLDVSYTGLSLIKSELIRFKYKLEGLDSDWIDVGTRRTAYYSYLPPGTYTFRVIAANADGVWNTEGKSFTLVVVPAFYRTWWFAVLSALLLAGVVLVVYRNRVSRLQARAAEQEAFARQLIDSQERERTRIAAELHDGLSQSLVIIKNRAMLSLIKPDDHDRAMEQLKEIAEASTSVIDEVKEIVYDLRPIQLDRLGLTKSIEDIVDKVASAHEFTVTSKLDDIDGLFPKEFENSIYRIVQESLNNIIKHAGANTAEVLITRDANDVTVSIKDDGKGFEVDATNHDKTQRGGFGLTGMVERARLLGGHASIESSRGKGATVTVVVPIRPGGQNRER